LSPTVITTTAVFDPAQLVADAVSFARALGAGGTAVAVILLVALVIWGVPWGKGEKAPAPLSDGGTAADRELPPAREGGGEPGGGPTGGMGG
jgi:hypothetical protein